MKSIGNGKPIKVWKKEISTYKWTNSIGNILALFCTFIWFLAVIKVFVLEDHRAKIVDTLAMTDTNGRKIISPVTRTEVYVSQEKKDSEDRGSGAADLVVPKSSEWDAIRAPPALETSLQSGISGSNNYGKNIPVKAVSPIKLVSSKKKSPDGLLPASELRWPPVKLDGTVPENEGFDVMPLTGLKVPKFFELPSGENMFSSGSKVDGQETIFLMIASYRDFQCRETITSAFRKADHPERLFVGAVDQVVPGDVGCTDLEVSCDSDPTQPICKYRSQIAVYKMDAGYATGPVTARHIGDRMYRGEYFVMQMDAHCLFVRHWDTMIISQWRQTGNEMAVLSSYLTDVQGSIDSNGDSTRDTRPIMCNSDFEGAMPARYLRHGSQPEEKAVIREMPQLQPFWAAGFSFSRGHFKLQVPYDGYQPMVFQGEEIAIGIRGFTYGYDFYAPRDSVVFHEYAERSNRRKKVHMFWENSVQHKGEGQKSLRRATSIIGMAPDVDPSSWDHTDESRYGLGTVRTKEEFYRLFLIDPVARKAVQLCPFVRSGNMHHEFMKHLRKDGMGIDYSELRDFDTQRYMGL